MATITTRSGKGSPLTNSEVDSNFSDINTELSQKESASNKGVANGYASLDGSGKVPSTQLPSYVDDVVEGANLAALPATGETGTIYVTLDTNKTYRWSGSAYVEISASPGSTDAVTEGSTNLYFTNARARSAISASGSLSYNSTTGVLSYTAPTAVSQLSNDSGYITSSALSPYLTSATAASTYQTALVSGTSIKTVNGNSLLGSGNIQIDAGVASFNTRTGAITLTSGDVTTALGYTPYNATNPSGYITSSNNITGTAAGITGYTLESDTVGASSIMTRNASGDSSIGSRFHFRTASAYNAPGYALIGMNWGGAAGTYRNFAVYDYVNSRPMFESFGETRNFTVYGALSAVGATLTSASTVSVSTWEKWTLETTGVTAKARQGSDTNGLNFTSNARWTGSAWAEDDTARKKFAYIQHLGSGRHEFRTSPTGAGVSWTTSLTVDESAVNSTVALQQGGNQVLHAGNYNSYAPTLTGTGASGTWGINVTGNANSASTLASGAVVTGPAYFRKNQTDGSYTSAALWTESYGNTNTGIAFHISGVVGKFLEMRTNGILYWNGDTMLHSGNYSSYALPLSGAATVTGHTNFNVGVTVNSASPDGYGINLYTGSGYRPTYGLYFGQTGTFGTYGAVSADWATYLTMNSTANRGWIFREVESLGNVAAISNQGNMTLRSHFEQGNNIARPNVSWSAGSTSNGMVIFYLPGTTANYGMVHMVFDIYEYNGNAASTVIVGGHNWSTSWYNVSANVIGQCGKEVRLGFKDNRFCVVFGTSGSTWEYGTIVLRKIHNASFYDNVMDMVGNWSATQTTTESFTNITGDLRALRTPASFNANGAITQSGNQVLHAANYTSYALPLSGGTVTGTTSFTRTDDNAISVGTIRGRSVGGQTGDFIHMYERVHIGSPLGWGSRSAPSYGLSTYGGCSLATDTGSVTISGNTALHAGNYTSYSPSLTGSGASGTWGISISGSAAQLNGYSSAENGGSVVLRTASNGYLYLYNWINVASAGLFSSVNGAHWYPNNGSYGAWKADGSRNGWGGIEFPGSTTAVSLMIEPNGDTVGFHAHSYGWKFRVAGGTAYVGKNYWGANEATILDSSNYTSYSPSLTGSGASGTWGINITGNASTVSSLNGAITILSGGGGATFGANHYSMGKDIANGSWSHPHYSDLIIGYHTGIRLGAAYSGIRFYANSPTTDANNDGNGDQGEALLMTVGGYALGGSVNIVNDCYAYGYRGHSNVAGTGQASYHPAGIYSVGTNWLYGTIYMNGNIISGCGNIYLDTNHGNSVVGLYSSYRYQGVFAMGDSYKMSADGASLANMYGIAWSHPNAGGAAGNLTDHGMLIINNGSFRCAISNSIVASGNITAYSDERLKRNWRDMPENFVERLAQVRVGCYERIDDGTQQVGVSAQSLQPLLPEAIQIAKDEIGTLSVSYGNAAMASAVELAKELVALKRKVTELEARIH